MLRTYLRGALAGVILASLIGCTPPTSFRGDAQFPGGALGCFNQCQKIKMEMATFVYVGAYSTACACKPKVEGSASPTTSSVVDSEGSVVAASAGVELQRRHMEQQPQTMRP